MQRRDEDILSRLMMRLTMYFFTISRDRVRLMNYDMLCLDHAVLLRPKLRWTSILQMITLVVL